MHAPARQILPGRRCAPNRTQDGENVTMNITYTKEKRRFPARQFGFNLLELMITLMIIAIVSMFAYPVIHAKRAQGKAH